MKKFSSSDISAALDRLGMLEYWPSSPAIRAEIHVLLAKMVPHREALDWLIDELVNRVGRWPGPAELRGILCSRYDPADGIDAWSTLPGYTAEDGEARYLQTHEQLQADRQLAAEPARLLKRLAGARQLPPALPADEASAQVASLRRARTQAAAKGAGR
jgi:hypothetical protein